MYAFRLCRTFSQLARIQNGIVNVVSSTKYSESPSIPNRSVKNPGVPRPDDTSDTNWYPSKLESNSPHITIDTINVISDVTRVVSLIRDWLSSDIVHRRATPRRGRRRRVISIGKIG